jgi:predicted metalloprotease
MSAAVGLTLVACGVDVDVTTSRADISTQDSVPSDTTDVTGNTTDDTGSTSSTDPSGPTTTSEQVIDASNDIADVVDVGDNKEPRSYDEFVAAALSDVQAFWRAQYPEVYGEPFRDLEGGIFAAYPNREDIPGCGEPSTSYRDVAQFVAFYCTLGDFMVYDDGDRSLLGALAENFGPSIMGVVLAHEFGHAIQFRAGDIEQGYPTILTEQQADCFAGAWVRWASSGQSSTIELTDADIRGGLIAMVTVRDPVGTSQQVEGAHGSAFDRVGAFQVGFNEGAQQCSEILDDPLPLVTNEFVPFSVDEQNEGDLPYGFEPDDIVPLVVTALNLYWTFDSGGAGIEFPELTLVPVSSTDEITCDDLSGPVEQTAVVCPSTNEVYVDEPFAERLYNDPIEGRADFAVGYLIATGWAEEAQILLSSPLTGEQRALANDCLVGAWSADMLPRDPRPEEGENRGQASPGDLDEAVLAAITIGDPGFGDDRIGSAFEKIDSFREGVLGGIPACTARING